MEIGDKYPIPSSNFSRNGSICVLNYYTGFTFLQVKPNYNQEAVEALSRMPELSRQEKGNNFYLLMQGNTDILNDISIQYKYLILEQWKDSESLRKHLETPHVKQLLEKKYLLETGTLAFGGPYFELSWCE